jgi:hypothetical protein
VSNAAPAQWREQERKRTGARLKGSRHKRKKKALAGSRECFRLALAGLDGGDARAEGVENIEEVESNCRRRYNRLCENMSAAGVL